MYLTINQTKTGKLFCKMFGKSIICLGQQNDFDGTVSVFQKLTTNGCSVAKI